MDEKNIKNVFKRQSGKEQSVKTYDYSSANADKKYEIFLKHATRAEDHLNVLRIGIKRADDIQKMIERQAMQSKHFKDGMDIGIHSKSDRARMENNKAQETEAITRTFLNNLKTHYHQNYSLRKEFKDKVRDKGKNMDIGKE